MKEEKLSRAWEIFFWIFILPALGFWLFLALFGIIYGIIMPLHLWV